MWFYGHPKRARNLNYWLYIYCILYYIIIDIILIYYIYILHTIFVGIYTGSIFWGITMGCVNASTIFTGNSICKQTEGHLAFVWKLWSCSPYFYHSNCNFGGGILHVQTHMSWPIPIVTMTHPHRNSDCCACFLESTAVGLVIDFNRWHLSSTTMFVQCTASIAAQGELLGGSFHLVSGL